MDFEELSTLFPGFRKDYSSAIQMGKQFIFKFLQKWTLYLLDGNRATTEVRANLFLEDYLIFEF